MDLKLPTNSIPPPTKQIVTSWGCRVTVRVTTGSLKGAPTRSLGTPMAFIDLTEIVIRKVWRVCAQIRNKYVP